MAKEGMMHHGISVMDLIFVRVVINFISSIGTVRYHKKHIINDVPSKFWKLLLVRCLIGTVGYASFIYCLKFIPLFICTIIMNTAPFVTSVMGYFVNGEKITKVEIIFMLGAFGGIILLSLTKGGVVGT